MSPQKQRGRRIKSDQSCVRPGEVLGEQRYQELMRSLSNLFLESEHDKQIQKDAARQKDIEEIKASMLRHGLTVQDLDW